MKLSTVLVLSLVGAFAISASANMMAPAPAPAEESTWDSVRCPEHDARAMLHPASLGKQCSLCRDDERKDVIVS